MSRPLFSIIIPCYNSKPDRINELLNSIYLNNCRDNIEVIISDDRSTNKSYLEEVDLFKDKLNIMIVNVPDKDEDGNEISHCPGNTREYGVREATGEWITFIDHDDLFTEMALDKVKVAIENTGEQYRAYANFIIKNMKNNEDTLMNPETNKNWMHGKFFNLDNLWKKFDIHFLKNLSSHEDIYITNTITCIFNRITENILYIHDPLYICRDFPDTTTNSRSDNRTNFVKFINEYLDGYIESTINVYITQYDKIADNLNQNEYDFYLNMQADCLIFLYFYIQVLKYHYRYDFNLNHEIKVKQIILDFYKRFNMDSKMLYYQVAFSTEIYGEWYHIVRNHVLDYLGPFIETETFYDFISKF